MRRSLVSLLFLGGAACIQIPANIHAEFAAPRPEDRSNYRPGAHGSAPPVESLEQVAVADAGPPQPKAAEITKDGDGGAP